SAPTTTVHLNVTAQDNGGTANGGVDTSATQTFNINVTHANQPPVANPDSYDAVGNTELAIGTAATQPASLVVATGSVLANDTDTVDVFTGDGTTTGQLNGFTINHNGERLIGEGVALKASGLYNGVTNPQLRAAGTRPQVSNSAAGAAAVTIAKVGTLNTAEV